MTVSLMNAVISGETQSLLKAWGTATGTDTSATVWYLSPNRARSGPRPRNNRDGRFDEVLLAAQKLLRWHQEEVAGRDDAGQANRSWR